MFEMPTSKQDLMKCMLGSDAAPTSQVSPAGPVAERLSSCISGAPAARGRSERSGRRGGGG